MSELVLNIMLCMHFNPDLMVIIRIIKIPEIDLLLHWIILDHTYSIRLLLSMVIKNVYCRHL